MADKTYRKPPLTERVVSIGYSMDEESFKTKLDSWTALIHQSFPKSAVQTSWEFQIAQKNGLPYIPKDKQKSTTKYQFWRQREGEKECCIQVWRDRVSFNLVSTIGDPRSYAELRSFYLEWSAKWATHFGVDMVHGATIEYVNVLSEKTVPTFCKNGRIVISDIMTAFLVPGPLKNLMPPFKFQLNFDVHHEDCPMRVQVKLEDKISENIPLRFVLRASTEEEGRKVKLDSVTKEMDGMHTVLLAEFENFFTEKAKTSFEPV